MENEEQETDYERRMKIRRILGEAWMMCKDCGAKLYSFDGFEDSSRHCLTPTECKLKVLPEQRNHKRDFEI
jgi:hypothetical protein